MLALQVAVAGILAASAAQEAKQSVVGPMERLSASAQRQAKLIRSLTTRGDPAAVEYLTRRLEEGMPPGALIAFLEGARKNPRPAYNEAILDLFTHRRPEVRARAMLALAEAGPEQARLAVLAALDDEVLGIRLLGLDLAEEHSTPELLEAVIRLLDRDNEVATIVEEAQATR